MDSPPAIVHVHGGRVLLDALAGAGLGGDRLEWCDPVSCGPTPAGLTPDAWYRTRALYLAGDAQAPDPATVEARLREQDRALLAIPRSTEIVIWVGPELFCQAILMRVLTLLSQERSPRKISLADPGDLPGIRGCPLGQLPADGLARIFGQRLPAGADALALARRAWQAFTAADARALVALVAGDTGSLPHLGPALQRHLADLPDGATGLSTTETHLLQELDQGPRDLGGLLAALAAREARPFLTDSWLAEILRRLGGGPGPLVTPGPTYGLVARGRDVLAGHDFWAAERWHGGILIRERDEDDADVS